MCPSSSPPSYTVRCRASTGATYTVRCRSYPIDTFHTVREAAIAAATARRDVESGAAVLSPERRRLRKTKGRHTPVSPRHTRHTTPHMLCLCAVGIRTWLQGLFRGKWVDTSYKGRNEFQGRYKGESSRIETLS